MVYNVVYLPFTVDAQFLCNIVYLPFTVDAQFLYNVVYLPFTVDAQFLYIVLIARVQVFFGNIEVLEFYGK